MSDLSSKPPPHHGPVYAAAMYPELAELMRRHGYALAVHGSLSRDLDVIAVPWAETVSSQEDVLGEILRIWAVRLIGEAKQKPHGRTAYTLSCGWGECAIDLQFMAAK